MNNINKQIKRRLFLSGIDGVIGNGERYVSCGHIRMVGLWYLCPFATIARSENGVEDTPN